MLIFLVAISEYDQTLYEDSDINRMNEAAGLFESISNSRWFAQSSVILFMNKVRHSAFPSCVPFPITDALYSPTLLQTDLFKGALQLVARAALETHLRLTPPRSLRRT